MPLKDLLDAVAANDFGALPITADTHDRMAATGASC